MRNQKTLQLTFLLCATFLITNKIAAQNTTVDLKQDPQFEELLNEKRKNNPNLSYADRYKIQIYNGPSDGAKKTLSEFRQQFKNLDGTIVFKTPNYKVLVGNFRSRMEAERNLLEIKNYYKNVFLIKPGR